MKSLVLLICCTSWLLNAQTDDITRLVGALSGETPLIDDLRELCDTIGGRVTGTEANLESVAWGMAKFQEAGVKSTKEAFSMPEFWWEKGVGVRIGGDVSFTPRAVAKPFSAGTPPEGITARIVDAGDGTASDFARLGDRANGAFLLIHSTELKDLTDLFAEYSRVPDIDRLAAKAGAKGVVYMGSRPGNLLYRHNVSPESKNTAPMLIMEREAALRVARLLAAGKNLELTAIIDLQTSGPFESYNVIGEITGSESQQEVVVVGAHLDSWDLGTGALDNGCNVSMMIDIARQIKALGLKPKRTIRFVLFNGEEQGLVGSFGYTKTHEAELDKHVMAMSIDIGSGAITGFFTGGRTEMVGVLDRLLKPVAAFGPFAQVDVPVVGTDNYDFMMQGVANLVALHDSANYAPNYHARSDTFEKVDQLQLRKNAAIVAAVIYGFAQEEVTWKRHSRRDVEKLIESTDLGDQIRNFGLWDAWQKGERGLKPTK